MAIWFCYLIPSLLCTISLKNEEGNNNTLLSQATAISEIYSAEIAKNPPPPSQSQALDCQQTNWLSIDLSLLQSDGDPLSTLCDALPKIKEWGFNALHLFPIREEGKLGLPSDLQSKWDRLAQEASLRQIVFTSNLIGNSLPVGPDFLAALQKQEEYADLFHLIEINPDDWNILPPIPSGDWETNIPWLTLQELHKRGYVPEHFTPYVKTSDWNVTNKIAGVDGKVRRWIYLKEQKNHPCLAWLSPSFGAYRLAAGDALNLTRNLGASILQVDGALPHLGLNALSLWIRKIGALSAMTTNGTIASMKKAPTDFAYDQITPIAYLHALIAQNAGALQTIYRLLLENKIPLSTLIHELKPLSTQDCSWMEFLQSPNQKYRYFEEQITGNVLHQRLLKEDLFRLKMQDRLVPLTWVNYCRKSLDAQSIESNEESILAMHLLVTFAYIMQPGVFAASLSDLAGAFEPNLPISLTEPNQGCLYASLPIQQKNPKSFLSQLNQMLKIRNEYQIAKGELISVLPSPHAGTLLLLHRLPDRRALLLTALNFGSHSASETIEWPQVAKTTAIDLLEQLTMSKNFSSARFSFTLAPRSGKVIYFQPKYYSDSN